MMTAESADIRFECDQCGQHFVVDSAGAGLTTDCPICNKIVTVPPPGKGEGNGSSSTRHGLTSATSPDAPPRSPFANPSPEDLQEELIDASLISGKLLGDLTKAREEIARLQQQLKTRGEECEHLHASTTHTQAELKTFQGERAQLKAEITSFRQRATAAEEALAAREAELKKERAAAQEQGAKAVAAQKALGKAEKYGDDWKVRAETAEASAAEWTKLAEERDAAFQKAQETATGLETKAASLDQALASELALRDQLATELAERRREIADTQARILQRKNELHTARNRVSELEAMLAQSRENGNRLDTDCAELRRKLTQANEDLVNAGDLRAQLDTTNADLNDHRERLRVSEESSQALATRCDELRRDNETLRRDLMESHTGREMIEIRAQLDAAIAERERSTAQVQTLEADLHAYAANEADLREQVDQVCRDRDEAYERLEAISESRMVKDNDVLRGIVVRLNAEVAQQSGEVHRFKRARFVLKIAYVLFGIALIAVIAFALIILPHALKP